MPDTPEERTAFLKEFAAARDDILAYIYSLVSSHADAEDIFQDVSVLLWQKFGEFDPCRDFRAWARKFAWHTVQNWRRARKEQVWDAGVIEALDAAFRAEERERGCLADLKRVLERCLSGLSGMSRRILRHLYGSDMTHEDLGKLLHRSSRGLRVSAHRIRRKLRECIERKLPAETGRS
jgi:RNA polymerase sigma-70 factor (ECF subfamily)